MNESQLYGEPGRSGKGLRGALTGLLGAALLCIPVPALACTLYAAQGTAVADGGTIAAKNRDWRPQEQSLHLSEPRQPGGYRYYGLYGGPFERHQLRGGVNEAGLVAYSAAVSSVTKKQKAAAAEAHPPVLDRGRAGRRSAHREASKWRPGPYQPLSDRRSGGAK